jgi:type III secretion protein L
MAFHLIHADGRSLLASDRPLLRGSERPPVEEAVTLLRAVREWHDRQRDTLAEARARAATEGRQVGEEEGRAAFATAIADLTEQAQADAARREEDIAALALAALRQMIGTLPDGDKMAGVARRAVETLGSRGPILVEVSPAMLPHIERAFADRPSSVEISARARSGLTDDQCRLTAPDGRIVADVGVQIQSFATRWEVADAV